MTTRKEVEARLDGSPLKLKGKKGAYELHNVHNESNSLCSSHGSIEEVDGRVDVILGQDYGR